MQKSPDLLDLADICAYFGLSESTVRRKVRDSRDSKGNFPLPLFKSGCRVLWRRADIENWKGEDGEVITLAPPPPVSLSRQAGQVKSEAQIRKGLEALGVKLTPKTDDVPNNQPQL